MTGFIKLEFTDAEGGTNISGHAELARVDILGKVAAVRGLFKALKINQPLETALMLSYTLEELQKDWKKDGDESEDKSADSDTDSGTYGGEGAAEYTGGCDSEATTNV